MNGPNKKHYGVVSVHDRKARSGLEFVTGLVDGSLPLNSMARTLGYDIVECGKGKVVAVSEPTNGYLNPEGTVHGGYAATLLDSCMGLAVRTMIDKGFGSTTLELKISMLRPITPESGPLRIEGIVLSCGRRVGAAEGRITDGAGKLLAHGTTTCLIFER